MDEQDILNRLRARYEAEGYEVRKSDSAIASGDLEFAPDAVARRGEEIVLLAVKRAGGGPAETKRLERLAALADGTAQMAFHLEIAAPQGPAASIEMAAPSVPETRAALGLARRLAADGEHLAALLLAWPTLEAAARRAARLTADLETDPLVPGDFLEPESLAAALVSEGLIGESEHHWIADLAARAEAAHHGALGCPVPADRLNRLLDLIDRLSRPGAKGGEE
jgi:hypothetical protein